jgi:carbamoyl-phosphate synthase small subunit
MDLVGLVSTKKVVVHKPEGKVKRRVVLVDVGTKRSIIRNLVERGAEVVQVPHTASAKKILGFEPDGVLVSNGPGDPKKLTLVHKTIRAIVDEQVPFFGICFGNQLLAHALGGTTKKLKFGHRGGNQPVKDLKTGRVYVTSQNHGFVVDADSLDGTGLSVSHVNLNDGTVEGLVHKSLPVASVQYHPEASPGPWDSYYLFDEFLKRAK